MTSFALVPRDVSRRLRFLAGALLAATLATGCGETSDSKFDRIAEAIGPSDAAPFGFAPPETEPNAVTLLASIPIDDANGILALVDGTVVATHGPVLAAFDAASGTTRWTVELDGAHHRVAGFGGQVAITSGDEETVTLIDVETGTVSWVTQTAGFAGSVALSDRFVVVANDEDQLLVLDAATGETLWTLEHPIGSPDAGFSIEGSDLAVGSAGLERASLELFDLDTGRGRWFEEDGGHSIVPNIFVAPRFADDKIIYVTDGGGSYWVDRHDPYHGAGGGSRAGIGEPHVDAGAIAESFYVITDGGQIVARDFEREVIARMACPTLGIDHELTIVGSVVVAPGTETGTQFCDLATATIIATSDGTLMSVAGEGDTVALLLVRDGSTLVETYLVD